MTRMLISTAAIELAIGTNRSFNALETIPPRAMLFITGETARSREFNDDAYARAAEPKELLVIPGARHIDLYDRTDMIPFERLETFFKENLK